MPASSDDDPPVTDDLPVTETAMLPPDVPLHARPAAEPVRAAARLPVTVTLSANGKRANAKSILEVLALGATGGTVVTLTASGAGAAKAVASLRTLVESLQA
jgi:phosphotransferase system HPr (HPr) family protein